MAILAAVDALRAESRTSPSTSNRLLRRGGAGSPHLAAMLRRHRDTLGSDGWIIIDGPAHRPDPAAQPRRPWRRQMEVISTAPRPLHSGHYGNWAPNPGMMLAELLASMKDADGRVAIAGFYDDVTPLSEAERRAIAAAPAPDEQLRRELGLGWAEGAGATLTELIQQPSLNINGIRAPTSAPTHATSSRRRRRRRSTCGCARQLTYRQIGLG